MEPETKLNEIECYEKLQFQITYINDYIKKLESLIDQVGRDGKLGEDLQMKLIVQIMMNFDPTLYGSFIYKENLESLCFSLNNLRAQYKNESFQAFME